MWLSYPIPVGPPPPPSHAPCTLQVSRIMLLQRFCALAGVTFPDTLESLIRDPQLLDSPTPFGDTPVDMPRLVDNDFFVYGSRTVSPQTPAPPESDAPEAVVGPTALLAPSAKALFTPRLVMDTVLEALHQQFGNPESDSESDSEAKAADWRGTHATDYASLYRQAITHATGILGATNRLALQVRFKLAQECARQGEVAEAVACATKALELWRESGSSVWDVGYMSGCCTLGEAYEASGRIQEAVCV